eukprot:747219-Hanusia_phi.AAC.12
MRREVEEEGRGEERNGECLWDRQDRTRREKRGKDMRDHVVVDVRARTICLDEALSSDEEQEEQLWSG